jgi:hypothetical protein
MENLLYNSQILNGMCGIGILKGFEDLDKPSAILSEVINGFDTNPIYKEKYKTLRGFIDRHGYLSVESGKHAGGAGICGTGFISNEKSKKFYDALCKRHKLVWQTPVRKNTNSDNQFFAAFFDTTQGNDMPAIQPNWPFK